MEWWINTRNFLFPSHITTTKVIRLFSPNRTAYVLKLSGIYLLVVIRHGNAVKRWACIQPKETFKWYSKNTTCYIYSHDIPGWKIGELNKNKEIMTIYRGLSLIKNAIQEIRIAHFSKGRKTHWTALPMYTRMSRGLASNIRVISFWVCQRQRYHWRLIYINRKAGRSD